MNPIFFWLGAFILLLIMEAVTMGLTTIWFAGGALGAMAAALLGWPVTVQAVVCLIISAVLLFFTRPIALKHFNKEREKTNLDRLIDEEAIVILRIDPLKGKGQVRLNGMEWSAETEDKTIIPEGEIVKVKEIRGVKLIVEKKKENTEGKEEE